MEKKLVDQDLMSVFENIKKEKKKKEPLGRGLAALLGSDMDVDGSEEDVTYRVVNIPMEDLQAGSTQPREFFNEDALQELAKSIKQKGVLQPIIVRSIALDKYEIIAGERRFRASQIANLSTMPCIVTNLKNVEALEIALIENVQRENLNALEEAKTYKKLVDTYHHTHETLSVIIGKSRSYITNHLRILNLPEKVQTMLQEGKISAGHAKILVSAENPIEMAEQIANNKLSVRDTEARIKVIKKAKQKNIDVSSEIDLMNLKLNFSKKIKCFKNLKSDNKGAIEVKLSFADKSEAENFLKLFTGNNS